jgi:ABC-type nitrate/sulfonate/bicarbonate transport system ATPase subunit
MLEIAEAVFGYRTIAGTREITAPITLSIAEGAIVALVGPSGIGKSTILKSLTGLIPVLSGAARLAPEGRLDKRAWYAPQAPVLLPFRNVLQNALVGRELDRPLKPTDIEEGSQALADLGLADAAKADPSQLSGGMVRRLMLVQGLLSERRALLLDEPLAELDLQARRNAEAAVASRGPADGRTVIFASHDVDSVVAIADRVLILQAPFPARLVELSLEERFADCPRDPASRRRGASFSETVAEVQRQLWDQWDA